MTSGMEYGGGIRILVVSQISLCAVDNCSLCFAAGWSVSEQIGLL